MQPKWIRWSGGVETRDDGWVIYHDLRWTILKHPNEKLTKHQTPTEAKKVVDNAMSTV